MRVNKADEIIEDEVKVKVTKKPKVTEKIDTKKAAGRPTVGKSKATNKIAFVVDDEMLEYLENLTTKQNRTPNAVAKKLFIKDYEMHYNAKK